jgi:hypothetical protein
MVLSLIATPSYLGQVYALFYHRSVSYLGFYGMTGIVYYYTWSESPNAWSIGMLAYNLRIVRH